MRRYGNKFDVTGSASSDFLTHDHVTYIIKERISAKIGNLFLLADTENNNDLVLKICKEFKPKAPLARRFEREIDAIKTANSQGLEHVVKLYFDDRIKIDGYTYRYYVMERADCDLKYFIQNNDLDVSEKFKLCKDLLFSFKALHDLGIYHRDIKPENILLVNSHWKIADLGLINSRTKDFNIDETNEKIGPYGWLSPEATNKVYTAGSEIYSYDCVIDDKSDIFQLGKLFWYIFKGNIPVGQIEKQDFADGLDDVFNVIFSMLHYCKARRTDVAALEAMLAPLYKRFAC